MKLILINGESQSGKDTVAKMLSEKFSRMGVFSRVIGNADRARDICKEVFYWKGEKDKEGKRLLANVTKTGYDKDPAFWEKQTDKTITLYRDFLNTKVVIITDWRFVVTYEYFKSKYGIFTVRVERPDYENGHEMDIKATDNALKDFNFDAYIINCSDLDELREKVDSCCHLIMTTF